MLNEKFPILKVLVVVLAVCLAISLFVNGYFYAKLSNNHSEETNYGPTFFSFVWGPEAQNIAEGTLYINMTFEEVDGNLTVTVRVNDDDYDGLDFLLLQFDTDGNGTIEWTDYKFRLEADNCTYEWKEYGWDIKGGPVTAEVSKGSYPSPYHTCAFKPTEGYVFRFSFPIQPTRMLIGRYGGLPLGYYSAYIDELGIKGGLVRVQFEADACPYKWVYIPPFNFCRT